MISCFDFQKIEKPTVADAPKIAAPKVVAPKTSLPVKQVKASSLTEEEVLYKQLKDYVDSKTISSKEALHTKKLASKKIPKGKKLTLKGKVIVVDPGHGGDDPGAMGPAGIWEKELNLKIAFMLADYLEEKGAKVYMTRKTDTRNSLKQIVSFANGLNADAYVAVHLNSIDNSKISGTETYYYKYKDKKLANIMHQEITKGLQLKNNGLKKARLYVLRHSNMPTVLVEPAYVSNPQEAKLLARPETRQQIADALYRGLIRYLQSK